MKVMQISYGEFGDMYEYLKVTTFIKSTLCLQSESGHLFFPHLKSPVFSGPCYY